VPPPVFNRLLPPTIDNAYRGRKLGLWLFGLVVAVRILQSLAVFVNGRSVALSADGIPLGTYPPDAAQTALALFTLVSLARLVIALLCVLVLVRYRAAVPLMFTVLLLGFLGSQLVLKLVPIAGVGMPAAPVVNIVQLALMAIGLALSLWSREPN
jgi:hypothetical protein